ncbi:hypothetical protein JTB14_018592 [Gonioctena quinquepunctata]|nr:hypothetical protein JTB14_018592 [Gonioctena quinquepunctata]
MPGHFRCSVEYCDNTSTSNSADGTLSFHRFPKNHTVKQAWINYCRNSKEWVPNESARICSEHFDKNDFETNLQESLLHVKPRRTLVKNDEDSQSPSTSCIQQRCKEQEKIIDQLKLCNNTLGQQLSQERTKIKNMEKIIEKQNQQLSSSILFTDLNHKIKEVLSRILSPAQLDLVLKLKKKVRWSKEDLSKAITLRYFSKRAYLFLQKEKFPLPSIRTLQIYCGKINLNSGILKDVLKFMNIGADSMQRRERAVVLLFDEMKVSSLYEYNKQNDEVVGPHNYVQIVMARSLCGNWKQPVYIGFDQNMNTTLLMEIIVALHGASFEVVAVVGDCGSSNQGTLRDLGIDVHQVHFQHPVTEGKIFCFPDSPHLLKLIRNWLLRTGFQLSNGVSITKNLLEDMISKAEKSEISSLFKVTERHLNS